MAMSLINTQLQLIADAFGEVTGMHAGVMPPHEPEGASPISPLIYLQSYSIELADYGTKLQAIVSATWLLRLAPDVGAEINNELTILELCLVAIPSYLCGISVDGAQPGRREQGSNYMSPTIVTTFTVYLERTA